MVVIFSVFVAYSDEQPAMGYSWDFVRYVQRRVAKYNLALS